MNQFKRAKQLRAESGQSTESITDLKTAGVSKKEETISENIKTNKDTIIPQNIVPVETHNVIQTEIPNPNENLIKTETTSSEQTEKTANIISEHNSTETIEISTTAGTKPDNIKSDIINNINNSNNNVEETNRIINTSSNMSNLKTEEINVQPALQPTLETVTINNSTPVIEKATPITQTIITTTPSIDTVNSTATVSIPQTFENVSDPALSELPITSAPQTHQEQYNIQPTPIIVSQLQPEHPVQYVEAAPVKVTKNTKKSAPNIFSPKSEAKSMRKSLVLKPTSVKIAENYCAKNGGSFNELIQTLLDNFIDEYGL